MRASTRAACVLLLVAASVAQVNSPPARPPARVHVSAIALHESSRASIASEMGGAFMSGSKCDSDGNLYIRKLATDRPLLGPVVKIDPDGKRVALFDPVAFSELQPERADAFSPAPDGGLYQIASTGGLKRQIYVLHFSSDGSPASPIHLEADFEPHDFAAFPGGNLLVSGVQRDPQKKPDNARPFTAVFSADGGLVAQLSFAPPRESAAPAESAVKSMTKVAAGDAKPAAPTADLSNAEAGADGNIYALRRSSPALVYVISPAGKIVRTFKVNGPAAGVMPNTLHVSRNRLAVAFWSDDDRSHAIVVLDAQTGRKIETYSDSAGLGQSFACYAADESVFTFLNLGEENQLEVIRAEPR